MHPVTAMLTRHYEQCLERHGPTPRGMDWGPEPARLDLRFAAICRAFGLEPSSPGPADRAPADRASGSRRAARPDAGVPPPVSILDAGCGCGLLLDYLMQHHRGAFSYRGVDASPRMIAAAQARHPRETWACEDVTLPGAAPPCDWVVANGLLTERREIPHEAMVAFARLVVTGLFSRARIGVVFNVLSSHVNFRDAALFYWDPGEALAFCAANLSRHVVIWHDTVLYEYFCCIRREPWAPPASVLPRTGNTAQGEERPA
jgi:SAM-dependent methyltransferase